MRQCTGEVRREVSTSAGIPLGCPNDGTSLRCMSPKVAQLRLAAQVLPRAVIRGTADVPQSWPTA